MEKKTESKALNRVVAGMLTLAFLGFVFVVLINTVIANGADIPPAIRLTPELKKTLPENATRLDRLSARINSFTAEIAGDTWKKTEMGYVNTAFQRALGKRMINTGSQNMLTLNTGHLYDLSPYVSLKEGAQGIVELTDTTLEGLPFLFVYEHPTLYDDAMMPAEYAALDHSAEMADEALAVLREGGVRVLDSRDVLPGCGYALDDLLMVTDQHWSTLAAIVMGQAIAGEVNDMIASELDPSLLDLDQLNTQVHEKLFIGKYGQRIGPGGVTPDDIVEYWPKRDTRIHRRTMRVSQEEEAAGPFRETVTRFEMFETDPGKTWNKVAYMDYGLVEAYNVFENESAPDVTLLLLKDSYSAPIGTFMSLLARRVVCVDLRRDSGSLKSWVDRVKPDAVVMAYSLQMLRDDDYEFGE